jgi:hypothetical protein
MTRVEFVAMLDDLAAAWARRDYVAAANWFATDVRYADPLRYEFTTRAALLAFYETDEGYPQRTVWHTRLFDETQQRGLAEYTYDGTHRYHGAAIIRVVGALVSHWREYQHIDPRPWEDFSAGTAGL